MESWERFRDHFMEEFFLANPTFAVDQGRHDFDGRLPDWSEAGLKQWTDRLKELRRKADSFPLPTPPSEQRFERDYTLAVIDEELFWLETLQWPFKNPTYYSAALDPTIYLTRSYAPMDDRLRAYIDHARAMPEAGRQIRANLRMPLPRTYQQVGRLIFGGLASYLEKDVPRVFSGHGDSQLQKEFEEANRAAVAAMRELDGWLESNQSTVTQEFALGADHLREMLRATEQVDLPLDRLEEIGQQDLQENLQALERACRSFAPGAGIRECVARLQSDKPEQGPIEEARRQLDHLKQFVLAKNLAGIPSQDQAVVLEAPPHQRWNFAFIDIPGPYETDPTSIYYIAPPDPDWSEREQQDYLPGKADLLFTSIHEVWPGHFLQHLHSRRVQSPMGRVFSSYAFVEGWAHYTEELMWEAGLEDQSPEMRIGQALNALLRNVRLLSAIGLHTAGMTVQESEQMFREQAFQDAGNSRQQAARGTFDPGYLNYTLGKLIIRKLRQDWSAANGGGLDWRSFHDQLLSYGAPPLPLVRRRMLGPDSGPAL